MSRVTTYTCDKCGATSTDAAVIRLERVCIVFGQHHTTTQHEEHSADWCLRCRIYMGITHAGYDTQNKIDPRPEPPTLEELVREIIKEEIENAKQC
jgi:hypothetical protein